MLTMDNVQGAKGPEIVLEGKEITATEVAAAKAEKLQLTIEEAEERMKVLGQALRALIVDIKTLPRTKGLEPHQDPMRSLAQAQMYLQTGFLWLRKTIEAPRDF